MKAPTIEFPCDYPIKVMGVAQQQYRSTVLEVVERFDPQLQRDRVQEKSSSQGKYTSLTIWITATGEDQLKALHQALKATGMVKMVL